MDIEQKLERDQGLAMKIHMEGAVQAEGRASAKALKHPDMFKKQQGQDL